jgi:GNAT superfamily N-acetyltransferase
MLIVTKRVDYLDPSDGADLVRLLSEYAGIEHGDSTPDLSDIPRQLANFPTAFSVLAYADSTCSLAIGLVNCFFGFSTFRGKRLVNVHDVIVTRDYRGQGVSGVMLDEVEQIAIEQDCCRLTLEVLASNSPALKAYGKHGFARDPAHSDTDTLFLHKPLVAGSEGEQPVETGC